MNNSQNHCIKLRSLNLFSLIDLKMHLQQENNLLINKI